MKSIAYDINLKTKFEQCLKTKVEEDDNLRPLTKIEEDDNLRPLTKIEESVKKVLSSLVAAHMRKLDKDRKLNNIINDLVKV